jgi:penicillin-binding protein 1A
VPDDVPSAAVPNAPVSDAPSAKPVPPASVGQQPVAAAPAPARRVQAAETMPDKKRVRDADSTASIRRPVPPGDVGGPLKTKNISILDILTGG